jgi:hypothetical protein
MSAASSVGMSGTVCPANYHLRQRSPVAKLQLFYHLGDIITRSLIVRHKNV